MVQPLSRPRFTRRLAGAASEPFFGARIDPDGRTVTFYEAPGRGYRSTTLAVADLRTSDVQAIYRIAWGRWRRRFRRRTGVRYSTAARRRDEQGRRGDERDDAFRLWVSACRHRAERGEQ